MRRPATTAEGGAASGAGAAWYAWMLAGLLPLLATGFVASALADRLAFLGWGLAAALAYVVSLHRVFPLQPAALRRGVPLAVLALSFASFAGLAAVYGGELAAGLAAMLSAGEMP